MMDRRQEKIQATRHAEIITLLADVRQKVLDLFTGDIGDVNVAAYMLELQQERDTLQALLSDVIKERNELLDALEAHTALGRANVAASKKDELLQGALDNSKAAKAPLAELLECEPTLEAITAAIKSLKAAWETAKARRNEYSGYLKRVYALLGCEGSFETVEAAIKVLKSAPPPVAAKAAPVSPRQSQGDIRIAMTTVAETVRELASRGHKAEAIHRIINQRSEPSAVINLAGIRAIYDMVVPK